MSAPTTPSDLLGEVGQFLSGHVNELRDARETASQQLQAEPGNGTVIENLRVIGILQSLQRELVRQSPAAVTAIPDAMKDPSSKK